MRGYLLADGDKSVLNDEIIVEDNQSIDFSDDIITVDETIQTIGGIELELVKEITLVADDNESVTISNTGLSTVIIKIPDQTTISATISWNGTIAPPQTVETSGTVQSNYQSPTTAIKVGSSDVVLVFNKAVTLLLEGSTGQTAYKLSGTTNWVLIDTCDGSYDSPTDPDSPNECSITDGVDTKILTYHFTEFTTLSETIASTSSTSSVTTPSSPSSPSSTPSSSGGSGRTGVGPNDWVSDFFDIFVGDTNSPTRVSSQPPFPNWFKEFLVVWWTGDMIGDDEFKSAVGYLLDEKIINIDTPAFPGESFRDFEPSTKYLFKMWSDDKVSESLIIKIIHKHRMIGVW